MSRKLNRRDFLRLTAFGAGGAILAACGAEPAAVPTAAPAAAPTAAPAAAPTAAPAAAAPTAAPAAAATAAPAAAASAYKEAPMLAELVAAGKLPPVAERLPVEPLVVQPVESIGKYGGAWRHGWRGINDFHSFGRMVYEPMLRWPRQLEDTIQPGLAKEWSWSSDGKELTLVLRQGLKWSDGAPFTADDIIFWWEAIETDTSVTPAPHAEWVVNGKPMEVEKVDETTIKLKFDAPNGLAETVGLAFHGNQWPLGFERFGFFAPKHYLEQFHPKYNQSGDYKTFEEKANDYNVERPVMTSWKITKYAAGDTEMIAERNPYYWKVDPDGNQLPYIDRMQFPLFEDVEAINAKAIAGEIDMQTRDISLSKYPIYQENAEKGGYRTILWPTASAAATAIFFNQSAKDPKYRELFQNFKFRQAMSVAIDRDEINEVAYLGQGVPRTATVVPESPLYDASLEKLNAEFDAAKANALLDEIGLTKGADGFRTFADGSALSLTIETNEQSGPRFDTLELVAEKWRAVGVNSQVQSMTRDIYWPKAGANDVLVATWGLDRGLTPMVDPIYQFPFDERSWMAPAFGSWYKTSGKSGEETTGDLKQAQELYDQYRSTVDAAKQLELGKQIVRMSSEGLWTIGTVGMVPSVVVVKNNFRNVPEQHVSDWLIMSPGTTDPAQYYFDA
jgi:peptide/nickel transport system substrate-binding protein